jgi:hypothetical protein
MWTNQRQSLYLDATSGPREVKGTLDVAVRVTAFPFVTVNF